MRFITLALLAFTLAVVSVDARLRLGLAWGTDNRWSKTIAKGNVEWYWHWQEAAVPEMPSNVEYVPNFWGPKYWSKWNQRKQEIKKFNSKRILAFNEPDIAGQSDMSPEYAASVYMKELQPYRKKGVKVSSPQIVWDVKWMDRFLKALRAKGGDVDFMAVHWYGSYKELPALKKWVSKIHSRYNKVVWLTEYGVTQSSHPSQGDIKNFHVQATDFLRKTGYVKRAAWLGCFAVNNPPDSFAAARNAFFNSGGSLRSWSKWYVYSNSRKRSELEGGELADQTMVQRATRTPGAARHHKAHRAIIEAREEEQARREAEEKDADADEEDDGVVYEGEEDHCGEMCQKRNASLDEAKDEDDELSKPGVVEVMDDGEDDE